MLTTCESCLFAIKEKDKQNGCKFNRLDKFKKEFVNDKFYVLEGHCNSCRNINWYYYTDHPDATEEELINKCKEEISLSYNFLILHLPEDSVEDVIESVKFLESIKLKPKYIYILTTLDINKAKQLYIDVMSHTTINVKIDINENKEADEDILIRRGFDIAYDREYTAIVKSSCFNKNDIEITSKIIEKLGGFREVSKMSMSISIINYIDIFNQTKIINENYKFYIANFENFYIVDTLAAKQFLFEDVEGKDLKSKMLSIFDSYDKGGFNV